MKCAVVKFVKPWTLSHFSEKQIPATLIRPYDQNAPRKIGEASPAGWLHPRVSGPEVVEGPGSVIISPTWLGPVSVWRQQDYRNCWKLWRISSPSRDTAPATLPRGKAGMKMYEKNLLTGQQQSHKSRGQFKVQKMFFHCITHACQHSKTQTNIDMHTKRAGSNRLRTQVLLPPHHFWSTNQLSSSNHVALLGTFPI